ncbi:MAG: exopolysaccharide biosynthesis polyprenyl glycosylphosphotransferase [Candidatus Taylorbacteria bacterium]
MTSMTNSRLGGLLLVGDLIVYVFSLVLTLAIRYGEIPGRQLFASHMSSFSILIVVFIVVLFSSGLYDKRSTIIRGHRLGLLIRVQIVNLMVGIAFFYLAPVGIAPKANILIYFAVSTAVLALWRMVMFPVFSSTRKQSAIIVGKGGDIDDLYEQLNNNHNFGISFKERISPGDNTEVIVRQINEAVERTGSSVIVADFHNRAVEASMPFLYSLVFSGIQIIDASKMYEEVFDRVPLSMVGERWFVENSGTSLGNRRVYDSLKRFIDIVVSLFGGLVSLVFYPFVYIAIKLEDGGPIFITQIRVGKNGLPVRLIKFRSMSGNDDGKYGEKGVTINVVTRVGKILRSTRIDELPQFWNVLTGKMSLVGPRSELPSLVSVYEKEIPYYAARHLVKPGLSGWAQIYHENHPHHAVDTEDTKDKLSYDLYYIKTRSWALDMKIVLRTLQILMRREGR